MKHKDIPNPPGIGLLPEHNNPPFSIPGVSMPHWEIHDDFVDPEFHKRVYEYLLQRTWHQCWSGIPLTLQLFKPGDWDTEWANQANQHPTVMQPRTMFGSDEDSTRKHHPIIGELWDVINAQLGNKYAITGAPEGMAWKDYPVPPTTDPTLDQGWRVYANGTRHDQLSLQGYVHRDNYRIHDDTSVTILWVASLEWYPSWGGEILLYPEDPNGSTGDHQQFNAGPGQQRRNFQIGWPDEGKMVCLRPGRLILYDGRTLHSAQPTRHRFNSIMNIRVAFRARKIK